MHNKKWDLEESVALYDLYIKNGFNPSVPQFEVLALSRLLNKRAQILGIPITSTYRNENGLKMQLQCIEYVVSNGDHGLSCTSKLFNDTWKLYQEDKDKFYAILDSFYKKYN